MGMTRSMQHPRLACLAFALQCKVSGAWSRECGKACKEYGHPTKSLAAAKQACASSSSCAAVVDFSGNGGIYAACIGTDYVSWPKVCIEHQALVDHRTHALHGEPTPVPTPAPPPPGARKDMFAYHKKLLPLDAMDVVTFSISAVGLMIAAGGGIGGGGIIVPLYMLLFKFHPKHAIALSNITIFGGSIMNTIFNVQKVFPDGRSVIDWDIIVMMEPSTIAGAVMGAFASKVLPDIVLTISLAIILALMGWRTLSKGYSLFKEESDKIRQVNPANGQRTPETDEATQHLNDRGDGFRMVNQNAGRDPPCTALLDISEAPKVETPWSKIMLLVLCFIGCVTFTLLKGSGSGSIIGVQCGSLMFWFLSLATIPYTIAFGMLFRRMLIGEHEQRMKTGNEYQGAITWDSKTTITYPLICTLAGIFAGLFGVGGGIVKGPLMIEVGVNPLTSAATAATMILFTASAACVSFQVFGLVESSYGLALFILGIVCTAIGQAGMNHWMKSASRQSPPVLSIGTVITLSAFMVMLEGVDKLMHDDMATLFAHASVCSTGE